MSLDAGLAAAAILADDLRGRMYAFVRRADGPVTRDEVAAEFGISHKLAAFHLDKLAAAGLLRTSFTRPSGLRRVGRTPKRYEPAEVDVQVSIPPREHALLADILLSAVLAASDDSAAQAALRVAGQRGRELGLAERAATQPGQLGAERSLTLATGFLERSGFEPVRAAPTLMRLRNCPFHPRWSPNAVRMWAPGSRERVPGRCWPARAAARTSNGVALRTPCRRPNAP